MKKLLLLTVAAVLCANCAARNETAANQTRSAAQNAPASNAAATPSSNTAAPANNSTAATPNNASNPDLDFTIVNKTGYDIKALYVGASGTGDWAKEDEVLKGRAFADGASMEIKFDPRAAAGEWDIRATWADGSGSEDWYKLKLTEIEKITLVYDPKKDETSALVE